MTTDVIRYSGNLKLSTAVGGSITLDTGNAVGNVVVTGNLTVLGTQTNVTSTNVLISDNIIVLNKGETGIPNLITTGTFDPGVTLDYAGISIDRGTGGTDDTTTARWLYEDDIRWGSTSTFNQSTQGVWSPYVGTRLSAIRCNGILFDGLGERNDGRFSLLGRGPKGVLSVRGQTNLTPGPNFYDYAANVKDIDDIPNKKYVDEKYANTQISGADFAGTATQLRLGSSAVIINDISTGSIVQNKITVHVSNKAVMTVTDVSVAISGLTIASNQVRSDGPSENLELVTNGTGTVVIENGVTLKYSDQPPLIIPDATKVYTTSSLGLGNTGIMFATLDNRANPPIETRGELISARKALIYSIIF